MCWILAAALSTCALDNRPAADPSTVLTCARDIRLLPPDRAGRKGVPVRLEAVITFIDSGDTMFVQDRTAGTHVHNLPRDINWRCGYRVLIEGQTLAGLYVPGIRARRIEMLGPGEPPVPLRVTIDDLSSGVLHYQWVEVEGIGRSTAATGENTSLLRLAAGSRMLEIRVDEGPPEGVDLVDTRIRVQGLAAGVINNRRQLVSPYLKVRDFRDVSVIEPPPEPARLPLLPLDGLLRFAPEGASERRVRVRGTVISAQPGEPVFLRNGERAIMVESRPTRSVRPGDVVEVLGFPQMGTYRAFLADARLRRIGRDPPPAPRRMTIGELLKTSPDADLVTLEGLLVASHAGPESFILVLQAGNTTFRVRSRNGLPPRLAAGSQLSVSGICRILGAAGSTNRDYNFKPESFELWADSPDRIRLLSMPSWWTPHRLSAALGALVVATGAALVWIFLLRRRLREQTAIIRTQFAREVLFEERQRISREVHDSLEQELVGLSLRLDATAAIADSRTLALLETTRRLVARIQSEVRDLVWNLREQADGPRELGQSLARLTDELQKAAPATLKVVINGVPWYLPGRVEHNLLRIAQEAVTNALKHADPQSVEVEVSYEPDHLSLRIRDDGRGLDADGQADARPGHFGLIGMRERARKIAAQLELVSTSGRGTTVEVKVPRPRPAVRRGGTRGGPWPNHDPGGG